MGGSRVCELCQENATIYCCADEAYICSGCDSKVHGANFIVARHLRSILCGRCQAPTSALAAESSPAFSGASPPLCPTCSCSIPLAEVPVGECIDSEHSSTEDQDLGEVSSKRVRSKWARSRSPSPDSVIPSSSYRKRKERVGTVSKQHLETAERLEYVLRSWERQLGLDRSSHRVGVAMELFTRTAASIKANRLPKMDARAALAVCLWISLKLDQSRSSPPPPAGSFPRVDFFGRSTGIAADVLLTVEAKLCDELSRM